MTTTLVKSANRVGELRQSGNLVGGSRDQATYPLCRLASRTSTHLLALQRLEEAIATRISSRLDPTCAASTSTRWRLTVKLMRPQIDTVAIGATTFSYH